MFTEANKDKKIISKPKGYRISLEEREFKNLKELNEF